jgi:hypothetical protein
VNNQSTVFGALFMRLYEPACGVVDEHQERARFASLLEPVVIVAVDLDQRMSWNLTALSHEWDIRAKARTASLQT